MARVSGGICYILVPLLSVFVGTVMHCWPRYLLWLTIAVLGVGNMLSACGQKGPLYLPEEPAGEAVQRPADDRP